MSIATPPAGATLRSGRAMRGAALLLVLWVIVMLTGVITLFATAARTEGLQGRTLARGTVARYAAEAGIDVAVLHLQGGDLAQRWLPDGRPQRFDFEGHRIELRVVDEAAKVDLNAAPPEVLGGLFAALGVDQDRARSLAGAIMDWRDADNLLTAEGGAEDPDYEHAGLPYGAKDRPFETVAELRQVLGMDGATFERARPYLTVYTGQARPTPTFAGLPVLRALGLTPEQAELVRSQRGAPVDDRGDAAGERDSQAASGGRDDGDTASPPVQGPAPLPGQLNTLAAQGTGTYSISSLATRADGTRVRIQTTIRIGGGNGSGQLYLPLSWHVGESD
jgi:general secretion pathway protein K